MSSPHKHKKKSIGQMRLASIGALVVTLTMLASIALIRILAVGLSEGVREQMSFDIELPQSYNSESYQSLERDIRSVKGVKLCHYISADSALRYVQEQMGEDPSKILGYNPLTPIVRIGISAEYMNADSLKTVQKAIAELGLNAEGLVAQQSEQLGVLDRNLSFLEWLLWGLVITQAIFSFVQINNTTRMMIYAERLQIRTLTLVGASSWFVRRPIVLRSLFDGLVASLLTFALVALVLWGVKYGTELSLFPLLRLEYLGIAAVGIVVIALCASGLASLRATRKYINMDGRRIHLL